MSFYQTYRPKKIAELDLASVRDVLLSTLSSGKISHAYLFVGPRGSGKTSTARILAQIVNCEKNHNKSSDFQEPCDTCEACQVIGRGSSVDVIEIDAASNGLVDDIRDLRDKVRLSPVQLKKKVYIIDEVHMVSTAGFNALLKTLEEPPAHALFILCTTESQKVPETIVSRCARVNFTKATIEEVVGSLMKAVKGEKLNIEEEILREIAEATDGSFREGHKILEQISAYGSKINEEVLAKVLGVVGRHSVIKLLEAVVSSDTGTITRMFDEMEKTGVKATILGSSLLTVAKQEMEKKLKAGENPLNYLKLIDCLITAADRIKISPLPMLPLEIALLSLALDDGGGGLRPKVQAPAPDPEIRKDSIIKTSVESLIKKEEVIQMESFSIHPATETLVQKEVSLPVDTLSTRPNHEGLISIESVKSGWVEFLNHMSVSNGSLAGMLRLVSPVDVQGKSLTISVTSRFHLDMLERDVKRKLIEEQMAKVWGPMTFKCILTDKVIRMEPIGEDANISEPKDEVLSTTGGVMEAAEKIFG